MVAESPVSVGVANATVESVNTELEGTDKVHESVPVLLRGYRLSTVLSCFSLHLGSPNMSINA